MGRGRGVARFSAMAGAFISRVAGLASRLAGGLRRRAAWGCSEVADWELAGNDTKCWFSFTIRWFNRTTMPIDLHGFSLHLGARGPGRGTSLLGVYELYRRLDLKDRDDVGCDYMRNPLPLGTVRLVPHESTSVSIYGFILGESAIRSLRSGTSVWLACRVEAPEDHEAARGKPTRNWHIADLKPGQYDKDSAEERRRWEEQENEMAAVRRRMEAHDVAGHLADLHVVAREAFTAESLLAEVVAQIGDHQEHLIRAAIAEVLARFQRLSEARRNPPVS